MDLDELFQHLEQGEHAIFRFSSIDERLFVDFRTSDEEGPAVLVLPPVTSMQERFQALAEARPNFPPPDRLAIAAWPFRVKSLVRHGIIEAIRHRLAAMDAFAAIPEVDAAYERLLSAEREETRRAITGEGYETLWPKPVSP